MPAVANINSADAAAAAALLPSAVLRSGRSTIAPCCKADNIMHIVNQFYRNEAPTYLYVATGSNVSTEISAAGLRIVSYVHREQ